MTVATLSGRLLARKGAARPSSTTPRHGATAQPKPAPSPTLETVQPPPSGGERARISIRLDPARHRRLRLAAAHLDCSLQDLMIAAMDGYLANLRLGCPCLENGAEACVEGCPAYEEDAVS